MSIYSLAFLLLFPCPLDFDQALEFSKFSHLPDSLRKQTRGEAVAANIIFKSTDGGETWQDISEGLPQNLLADGIVEKDSEVYIRAGNEIYQSKPNSTAPFWTKEVFPAEHSNIASVKTGMFAYNYGGQFLQKTAGTDLWLPMYTNLQQKEVRTVFETKGAVFIGSDNGLFKSTDSGKTWKQVYTGGWVMKLVESSGVMMATSQKGILRSADNGENWESVISEGGVGIAIERINGGFAAITYNTESETRRVRTSYDGGKSWQAIDAGLPASFYTSSIIEAGEYLFCGHPGGIFRSSDKGKTWKLLFPAIEDKVFNLSVAGNAIYAMPKDGGC
jgi:photosystem II stability/assembly factor-like uncharacterized protein